MGRRAACQDKEAAGQTIDNGNTISHHNSSPMPGGISMHSETTLKGGCLCGRVRYEITGPVFDADHCHCSMCRRQHGAAFATYAACSPDGFNWVAGEDHVKVYETSAGAGWCFCSECGSSLAGTENGKVTTVTLGTVEGDPGIKPTSHIFVGSKANWDEINDALPQFEQRPPNTWTPPS